MGEVLEAFTLPHLVSGWMRGSHTGPLMPVAVKDSRCTRFDGPPRVIGLGFQVSNGRLLGPVDFFEDVAFDLFGDLDAYFEKFGKAGAGGVHLAGAGPALFTLETDQNSAREIYRQAVSLGLKPVLAKTMV